MLGDVWGMRGVCVCGKEMMNRWAIRATRKGYDVMVGDLGESVEDCDQKGL